MSRFRLMAELPSGAVTFLFSDIEGSTGSSRSCANATATCWGSTRGCCGQPSRRTVVTRSTHRATLSSSPSRAHATRSLPQSRVSSHSLCTRGPTECGSRCGWECTLARRSRPEADIPASRSTAPRGSAPQGTAGQILVSQATQTLVEDEEEDLHIHLQDLGEQRLNDLDRPVRLYQAAADGLPTEFVPLRPDAELGSLRRRRRSGAAQRHCGSSCRRRSRRRGGRGSPPSRRSGVGGRRPNSVAVVDPANGRVVDDIQVGTRPGPVTFGAGSVWVGNLDDRTVTRIDAPKRTVLLNIAVDDRTPTGLAFGFATCGWPTACADSCRESTRSSTMPRSQSRPTTPALGAPPNGGVRPARTRSGRSSGTRPWRESNRYRHVAERRARRPAGRHRRRQRISSGSPLGPCQGLAVQPRRVPGTARRTQRWQAADGDRRRRGDLAREQSRLIQSRGSTPDGEGRHRPVGEGPTQSRQATTRSGSSTGTTEPSRGSTRRRTRRSERPCSASRDRLAPSAEGLLWVTVQAP